MKNLSDLKYTKPSMTARCAGSKGKGKRRYNIVTTPEPYRGQTDHYNSVFEVPKGAIK